MKTDYRIKLTYKPSKPPTYESECSVIADSENEAIRRAKEIARFEGCRNDGQIKAKVIRSSRIE